MVVQAKKKSQMKKINLILLVLISALSSCKNEVPPVLERQTKETEEEHPENQELFNLIKEKDSLLFQIGFNQIDTAQVSAMTSEDFEFYHDEHGITESKSEFVNNINGIRELPFKTWRTLIPESMEVFPMYDDRQVLYGAIQNGTHDFYQQNEGEAARKTNTARFTHLWIVENGDWKLKRVLSYDHQIPK